MDGKSADMACPWQDDLISALSILSDDVRMNE